MTGSDKAEAIYGKLTDIIWYWMCYKQGGNKVVLSFGLGPDVAVNSIVGSSTLCQ